MHELKRMSKKVISFSLFGSDSRYTDGAIANVRIARELFPDWTCRFYVDDTVPTTLVRELGLNAEVIIEPHSVERFGCIWRFYVLNDVSVDVSLIRDVDSMLRVSETELVSQWLLSKSKMQIISTPRRPVVYYEGELFFTPCNVCGFKGRLPLDVKSVYASDWSKRTGYADDDWFLLAEILPYFKDDLLIQWSPDAHIGLWTSKEHKMPLSPVLQKQVKPPRRVDYVNIYRKRTAICKNCAHKAVSINGCKLAPQMSKCFKKRLETCCPDSPPKWKPESRVQVVDNVPIQQVDEMTLFFKQPRIQEIQAIKTLPARSYLRRQTIYALQRGICQHCEYLNKDSRMCMYGSHRSVQEMEWMFCVGTCPLGKWQQGCKDLIKDAIRRDFERS